MPLTPQAICDQLLAARTPERRERLLAAAAREPACLPLFLTMAGEALNTMPDTTHTAAEFAVTLAQRTGDDRRGAAAARLLAQARRALGRHADALTAFDTAAAFARRAGDALLEAQGQIGRIDSLGWLGRNEEAIALANRLITELRALDAPADAAKALANLGSLHYRRDHYSAANACYEEAAAILRDESGDPVAAARLDFNRANILMETGQTDAALTLFAQARAVFEANAMPTNAAMTDSNIGYLRYVSGEYAAALASYTRARTVFLQRGLELESAKCDASTADVYHALNLLPEALACCARASVYFERVGLEYERGRTEWVRAASLFSLGQTAEALTALERAEAVFTSQRNAVRGAYVRLLRALLLRQTGNFTAAVTEAAAAQRVFARSGLAGQAAEARFLVASVALESGENSTRTLSAIARTARRTARGWLECRAEQAIGQEAMRRGNTARSLRHFRAAVAALEAARTLIAPEELHTAFMRDKLAVYEYLVNALLLRGRRQDIEEAFATVERARSRLLLERVQSALEGRITPPETNADTGSREELAALRAQLSRLYFRIHAAPSDDTRRLLPHTIPSDSGELPALEQCYRERLRESELADLQPHLGAPGAVTDFAALKAALAADETLVAYYQFGGELCAFVLTKQGISVRRSLARQEEIEEATRRLHFQLQRKSVDSGLRAAPRPQMLAGAQRVLAHLYDRLLRPLESLITGEKITVIPHGCLHGLPFHAFHDGTDYALAKWEFTYAPSAAIWQTGAKRDTMPSEEQNTPPENALLMGIPDEGIAHVSTEIEQVARLLPGAEVYCGERATVGVFRERAGSCRILHLATHALFRADNPLFSSLRFADGSLLARDLYEMRLHCDLATLSACSTGVCGVESGDELFGLIRGFLAAGARSLAVSLWSADDAATAALMTRFYYHLAQGASRAAALRQAQREQSQETVHPFQWAAFALYGAR